MLNTLNLSDRAVNLLARWDDLEGSPLGTPASQVDPETALILEVDGDVVAVSSPEELSLALMLNIGVTVEEYEEEIAEFGGAIYHGIAEVK